MACTWEVVGPVLKLVGPSAPAYAQNPTAILIPTVKQEGSVELP